MFSLYRNPDLDDRIYECVLAAIFYHQEWLGSTTTNRLGVAVPDFETVSGCDQLVTGRTHAHGGTVDDRCFLT